MMEEEILEYNRLIAEFMGAYVEQRKNRPKNDFHGYSASKKGEISISCAGSKEFCINSVFGKYNKTEWYHNSYDWLMPVVEKINNLPDGKWYVHISDGDNYPVVRIEDGNNEPQFDVMINVENCVGFGDHLHLTKLEAVYIAVIKFINLYNGNKI